MLLIAGITALAGCGTDGGNDRTVTETSPPGSSETELTVVLDYGDGTPPEEWSLTCDPDGGSHPDPAAACEALAEMDPQVLDPVPPNAMCTMIYGGPQTATLTGRWNGAPVDAEFSRENGCEIARWDAAVAVLGDEGGVRGAAA